MRSIAEKLRAEFVVALIAAHVAACGDSSNPNTPVDPNPMQAGASGVMMPPVAGVPAAGAPAAGGTAPPVAGMPVAGASGAAPVAGGAAGTPVVTAGTGAGGAMEAGAGGGAAGASGAAGMEPPMAGSAGSAMAGMGGTPAQPVTCKASTLKAGDTTMRTAVGGRNGGMRTYIVHVPASYDGSKPVPLMVNFHPLIFGTGAGQRRGSGWAELGDKEGFISAFPDGYDAAWDIGNCCTRGDVDDMAFAKAIVSEISAAACIDPNRVYASGYSMGGGMTHLLGCKAADIFAAIAPSAFDLTKENHTPCQPSRPITMVLHRGMSDTVVPYAGGPTTPPNGTPVTVTMYGAVGSFDEWSKINKCMGEPVVEGNCRRRSGCENGTETVLCNITGHTEGPANVIWNTLKKHGLSGPL